MQVCNSYGSPLDVTGVARRLISWIPFEATDSKLGRLSRLSVCHYAVSPEQSWLDLGVVTMAKMAIAMATMAIIASQCSPVSFRSVIVATLTE